MAFGHTSLSQGASRDALGVPLSRLRGGSGGEGRRPGGLEDDQLPLPVTVPEVTYQPGLVVGQRALADVQAQEVVGAYAECLAQAGQNFRLWILLAALIQVVALLPDADETSDLGLSESLGLPGRSEPSRVYGDVLSR